jgi:predicted  nucleic acid-binding Zn-ribbon protein
LLPELKQLIEVQELDKEILEVTQTLGRFPGELQAQAEELARLKQDQEKQARELEELQKQRRETELEMTEMESGIKKSRQRLMEIKSNIEYKAMLKEIAFKEDQRDKKETRILELMEQVSTQNQAMAAQAQQLEEQRQAFSRRQKEIAQQTKALEGQLAELEKKRERVRQGLPAALLKRYEFIRQRRNGTAIAEVRQGVCLGCHMNILPQQFIDLQKGEEILQCPHCQRILYWRGEEEAPGEELTRSAR